LPRGLLPRVKATNDFWLEQNDPAPAIMRVLAYGSHEAFELLEIVPWITVKSEIGFSSEHSMILF
jgi:hypothetical protein